MRIPIYVPDGTSGKWEISTFTILENDTAFKIYNLRETFKGTHRYILPGTYKKLTKDGHVIMSNTPAEIEDHIIFFNNAKNSKIVLINGLGLGMVVKKLLDNGVVEEIIVIEKSQDVINLVAPSYKDEKKVTIIHADAFTYKPPKGKKYDAVWSDIWEYISEDNLIEMTELRTKYSGRTEWHGCWAEKLCNNCIDYNSY